MLNIAAEERASVVSLTSHSVQYTRGTKAHFNLSAVGGTQGVTATGDGELLFSHRAEKKGHLLSQSGAGTTLKRQI